jgi:pilus assembly protein Flp/PilA
MKAFVSRAKDFLRSEDGPTATEYAVMLALIIVVALAAITGLGTTVDGIFTDVDQSLLTATGGGTP